MEDSWVGSLPRSRPVQDKNRDMISFQQDALVGLASQTRIMSSRRVSVSECLSREWSDGIGSTRPPHGRRGLVHSTADSAWHLYSTGKPDQLFPLPIASFCCKTGQPTGMQSPTQLLSCPPWLCHWIWPFTRDQFVLQICHWHSVNLACWEWKLTLVRGSWRRIRKI